ncbi:MAG: MarR family transcriptional regulator [Clostridiales bacterium]|nr:MarR family transcriptional regulator [Clostridiales bacterium]
MEFGSALRRINLEFMRLANRTFDQHGLTAPQAEALFFLMRRQCRGKPAIQRDIEEALKLSNPTVSGTLDRLEKKGLVERRPDPENRRVNQIVLTKKALAIHEEMKMSRDELERQLLSSLTGAEQEALDALLKKILASISES